MLYTPLWPFKNVIFDSLSRKKKKKNEVIFGGCGKCPCSGCTLPEPSEKLKDAGSRTS